MKNIARLVLLLGILSICAGTAPAQVVTGIPPFAATIGPDHVNPANLNIDLTIPIEKKPGRGLPFIYALSYNNSIWSPVSSSGVHTWTPIPVSQNNPASNWGFTTGLTAWKGSLNTFTTVLGYPPYYGTTETTYSYTDPSGTPHGFLNFACYYEYSYGEQCGGSTASQDGSGYSLCASSSGPNCVTDRSGRTNGGSLCGGIPGIQDTNGNCISSSGSNGTYTITDTLGQTALTISGSGTPTSPITMTYVAPSGANATYTLKYAQYTVRTNFGCSGVSEYGPTTQYLPSELDLPDGSKYTFEYETTPSYAGDVTGRLIQITTPTGGYAGYFYGYTHDGIECADGSGAYLERQSPDGIWTYSRTIGTGPASTTMISDPQSNQTVMNFSGIYPTETQVYQGYSTLLKTTYTCYNGAAAPCNSTTIYPPIIQRAIYVQWPDGRESETSTTYDEEYASPPSTCYCSTYGLPTETDEYDYGSNNSPGPLLRKTTTTYASLSNGIVNRPYQVSVYNGSGGLVGQTTYQYDQGSVAGTSGTPQHASITGSRGNATSISYYVSGSSALSQTFTYFDTGTVQTATDVNGAQTSYTYGACGNSFVTLVGEPLGLSRSMAWNCTGGVETSATDENQRTASTSYTDPYFWRPNAVFDEMSNTTNITYNGHTSVEGALNFGSSSSDVLATLDSLGRPKLSQIREAPGSSTLDSVETDYDSLGRPDRTTLPYAATAGATCSSCPGTTTQYDTLGRPTLVQDSGGGTTTYQYIGNDVLETVGPAPSGENTKRKQLEYDALGRLTSVCEITSAGGSGTCPQTNAQTGYYTQYTYDALGDLTGVTQGSQARSYSYDGLGRMTSEINPESGTTTYVYDSVGTVCFGGSTSAGDLVEMIDAAGNTNCYFYDPLHRLTDVGVATGPYNYMNGTPCKRFRYDNYSGVLGSRPSGVTVSNPYGRLAEAETDTCAWPITLSSMITDEWFSYDARGETTDLWESTPHSGGYYHSWATYWANGLLDGLQSNIGYVTSYTPDGEGRIDSAGNGSELTSTSYNPAGLPTQVNFASGDSDSFTYDPNTNRMTQYKFNVNGQSVIGTINWNANGTLQNLLITDPFNSSNTQSCSYTHGDLARLSGANCGSAWSQTFSYDAYGNATTSGNGQFQPGYNSNNQMQAPATYDADGNTTNDEQHTYTWDAYGRPATIDNVSITYDALGRAVEWNNAGNYEQTQYSPTGFIMYVLSGGQNLVKALVPMPGGTAEVWTPNAVYYRHSDWLGSSRLASTTSRMVYYDGAYAPFGQPYAETGTTDRNFTGMDQDIVSGLYDFPAREYNGLEGRWPSPDPAGLDSVDLTDPQTLNQYAYVRNSPLMMIDPDGTDGLNYYDCLTRDCGAFSSLFNGGLYGPSVGYGGMTDLEIVNWINQQDNQINPGGMYPEVTLDGTTYVQTGGPGPCPAGSQAGALCDTTNLVALPSLSIILNQGSWDPSQPFPSDPSGLGQDWQRDFGHRAPNDERYANPNGDKVDWHKGKPGGKGWQGKDHWHWLPGGKKDPTHYKPGDTVKKAAQAGAWGATLAITIRILIAVGESGAWAF